MNALQIIQSLQSTTLMGYIDPGAGSALTQLIISGGVGLAYALKIYWKTIVNFLKF